MLQSVHSSSLTISPPCTASSSRGRPTLRIFDVHLGDAPARQRDHSVTQPFAFIGLSPPPEIRPSLDLCRTLKIKPDRIPAHERRSAYTGRTSRLFFLAFGFPVLLPDERLQSKQIRNRSCHEQYPEERCEEPLVSPASATRYSRTEPISPPTQLLHRVSNPRTHGHGRTTRWKVRSVFLQPVNKGPWQAPLQKHDGLTPCTDIPAQLERTPWEKLLDNSWSRFAERRSQ
jgi:hypothetical protein